MKRFVFGSILRKLPLFIILTVVFSSIAIFSASNVEFVRQVGRHYYYMNNYGDPGFTFLIVFFFIMMTILPLFSMNYRYSLARADVFKQAAFKDKSIRYAEHLSTLVITLIGFTFAFLVFIGVLAFRNFTTRITAYSTSEYYYEIWYLQYVYFIPLYFVVIVFGVAQYFVSYLFVSRSNCVRNSIIILIMGELTLFAAPTIFASFFDCNYYPYTFIAYTGASPALPIISIVEVFNRAIASGENYFEYWRQVNGNAVDGFVLFMFVWNYLIFIGMTVLGIVAFTKEKDPSGEFAGKSSTKKPFQEIIFHAGFALFGTFISSMMIRLNLLSYFLFLVFFLAAYYPLYGTLIRNFKLKPWQIGVMAGVVLFMILVSVSNNALRDFYDFY